MNKLIVFIAFFFLSFSVEAQTSLKACQEAAEKNYPLIQQYDLIQRTTDLTVANIQKAWLPQLSLSGQSTLQSDVTSWPEGMKGLMSQAGIDLKGLKKDQYRVGVDLSQVIYDGGSIKNQKEVARQQGNIQSAQNEVDMYVVRQRVNEMYFALLLLNDQIALNKDLKVLLTGNEEKLASMFKNGTASESDYQSVKAERLNVEQQLNALLAQRVTLQRMLSVFCGISIEQVEKPSMEQLDVTNKRPELKLLDSQIQLADAQEKMLKSNLMPRISLFAQGFYGYPGYNMFEDMMRHDWSWNGMVGARFSWDLSALYTHRNDKVKIQLQRQRVESMREAFLFNNRLDQIQQNETLERYRKMMAEDEEIITLRSSVRKAAESKLSHGIIDVNDLVKEINNENTAKLQRSIHEIEMLKQYYDLKYTTNN